MKKTFLKAAVLALAVSLPSLAAAAVTTTIDLDAATGASTFVSQRAMTDANPLAVAGADANRLNFSAKIGFGVSSGQTRYIRLQYGNATLDAAHSAVLGTGLEDQTGLAASTSALDAGGGAVAIVQGGAAGDAYVIYQITAGADIPSTDVFDFAVPALRVTSNASPVTVSMQLHETAVSAVAGASGAGLLYSKEGNIALFGTGLNFTLTPASNTAAVTTMFTEFCLSSTDCTAANAVATKKLGSLVYDKTAVRDRDGSAITLGDIVTTANLLVTGDFTAAAAATSLFIDGDGDGTDCNTNTASFTLDAGQTTGTMAVNANAITAASGGKLCYTVDTDTLIPVQTVNAALDFLTFPDADTVTADVAAAPVGAIDHDGTVLKAPYFQNQTGTVTYLNLSNSSATAAPYTVSCLTSGSDATVGTAGTAVALRTTKLNMTSLGCPNNTKSVELTLAVPEGSVTGEVVRTQNSSGISGMDGMVGNQ